MKIIYKIVNSAAVLAFIPVLLLLPMFRFIMTVGISSSNQLMSLLGGMLGDAFDISGIISNATGIDIDNLPEYYKLTDLYDLFFAENSTVATAGLDASAFPEELINYFTAAAVLFLLALVFALLVFAVGLFTKKKLLSASFGAAGFISLFAANKCFTHVAQQLVSGKMSLISILENMEALRSYSSYLKYVDIDIRIFELSSAYTMMLVIFGAIILFNIGFHLYDSTVTK